MYLRITSKHPKEEVEHLVRFAAAPYDLRRVCVNVKNSQHAYRGRAYSRVPREYSNAPRTAKRLVVVCVGAAEKFPRNVRYPGRVDTPEYEMRSWQEAIVAVSAHEFHHVHQFQNKLRCVEQYCERAALEALERYRATLA